LLADRLAEAATTARGEVQAALDRRDWLLTGGPLRCFLCGWPIEPDLEPWQICHDQAGRPWAEHTGCHRDRTGADARYPEDVVRGSQLEQDQLDAYAHEQLRTIGPRIGNEVCLVDPEGSERFVEWDAGLAAAADGLRWEGHRAFMSFGAGATEYGITLVDTWTPDDEDHQDDEHEASEHEASETGAGVEGAGGDRSC